MRTVYVSLLGFAVLMLILGLPASSIAQVSIGVTVGFPPPDLPVYEQPLCPGDGYIWTPGYWAWDDEIDDYYWVPGTWVLAPEVGFLWTPGYWAWGGSGFAFYEGYWSFQVVGFYGGINYGYGYFGHGYEGGRWEGNRFVYNRTVNNIDVKIVKNVYEAPVHPPDHPRVSYNGGQGGVNDRPTPEEERAAHERHIPPVANQRQHVQAARSNPELRASANHGKPPVAATPRPGEFRGKGVVQAREGGEVHGGPKNAGGGGNKPGRGNAVHPNDIPRPERPGPANSGDAKADRNYQKEQSKLYAQQDRENQKLQRQQEKEHQQFSKRSGDDGARQQMEQRHQQQTQQLEERHAQQRQQLESRHPAPPKH